MYLCKKMKGKIREKYERIYEKKIKELMIHVV
jgi:hypothetical protein